MRLTRSALAAGFAVLASVALATSAWAWCSPYVSTSSFVSVSPSRAPAGTEVAVRVGHWAEGPVEVRWASATGEVLNTGVMDRSEEITIPVTIPMSAADGQASLVVVHGASQMAAPVVVSSGAGNASVTVEGESSTEVSSAGPAKATPVPAPSGETVTTEPSATAGPAAARLPAAVAPSTFGLPQAPASSGTATPAQAGRPVTGPLAVARRTAPPLAAPTAGSIVPVPVAGSVAPVAVAGGPSVRSLAGDAWSGATDTASSPGLLDVRSSATGVGATSGAGVAVGVFTIGLVSLAGGFALAEARRRKAYAGAPATTKG